MERELSDEVMEVDMFDLNPILPEIYTSQYPLISDTKRTQNTIITDNTHHLIINSTLDQIPKYPNCFSSSSSSSAVDSTLISFSNFNNPNQLGSATTTDGVPAVAPPASTWAGDNDVMLNFSSTSVLLREYHDNIHHDNDDESNIPENVRVPSRDRTPLQAQEHVMAERKRREKLSQLFISLSKLVPGLKKLDKASLLEDAVNYLKSLQERASVLEEQEDDQDQIGVKKSSCVNYSTIGDSNVDHDHVNSPANKDHHQNQSSTPEIKARISNRNVLVKIWCNKEKGLMSRIPREMEKIHLGVMDMRVMPFGTANLDITVLAEMHGEFCGTVKDIVEQLDHMLFFTHHPPTTS